MDKRLTGPELVKYLRQFPSSDDRGWAADEIESLTDIIKRQAEQNEAAHAEIQEQARLLGGGAERELRLLDERDAMKAALEYALVWHESQDKSISKQPNANTGGKGWMRQEHQEQAAIIRAALSQEQGEPQ